ncbi:hypothetical protein MWH03_01180 [Klebsiella pneumoniae]|nr:hypothetical protein [Klebsiella pneumoniae]
MNDITELAQSRLDFSLPLETESGEPVKYVCHDVIEYKCARVCVDVETGVVYSSPYVGLKIRNVSKYAAVLKFTEEAAMAYHEHEQGWISDMKCGDRSHEYLSFVRDPENILKLVEALEKAQQRITQMESRTVKLPDDEDGQAYGFGKWANGKLPATAGTMTIAYCEDAWRAAFEVFSSAAGIKVEAE